MYLKLKNQLLTKHENYVYTVARIHETSVHYFLFHKIEPSYEHFFCSFFINKVIELRHHNLLIGNGFIQWYRQTFRLFSLRKDLGVNLELLIPWSNGTLILVKISRFLMWHNFVFGKEGIFVPTGNLKPIYYYDWAMLRGVNKLNWRCYGPSSVPSTINHWLRENPF